MLPRSSIAKTIEPPSQIGSRISGYGSQVRSSDAVRTRKFSPDGVHHPDLGVAREVEAAGAHLTASCFPSGE